VARPITEEEKQFAQELVIRTRAAQKKIEDFDQAIIDRAIQAVGWATANEKTFTRLAQMGVDESGLGDRAGRPNKRSRSWASCVTPCGRKAWESPRKSQKKVSLNTPNRWAHCRSGTVALRQKVNSV
jgi:hypothetical protein